MSTTRIIFSLGMLGCIIIVAAVFANNSGEDTQATLSMPTSLNTIHYTTGKKAKAQYMDDNILNDPYFIKGVTLHIHTGSIYDTISDSSIMKYVSRKKSLHTTSYSPTDLVTLSGSILTLTSKNIRLRSEAAKELESMAQEFTSIFNKKLVVVSAYRSYKYQEELKKNGCPDTLCAPAGHSEHQLGLAVDLFAATTANQFLSKKEFAEYYKRLAANAHRYGRHNTYQKGEKIDTYQVEPRHWRYVGRELATELYDKKMTFGEWITTQKK